MFLNKMIWPLGFFPAQNERLLASREQMLLVLRFLICRFPSTELLLIYPFILKHLNVPRSSAELSAPLRGNARSLKCTESGLISNVGVKSAVTLIVIECYALLDLVHDCVALLVCMAFSNPDNVD